MEAIKIDIKKEKIKTDNPYLRVAEFSSESDRHILNEGEALDNPIEYKTKTYHSMQVYNPETKKKTTYFVNTDDNRLFQELIEVSKGFIDKERQKLLEKFKVYDLPLILKIEKDDEMVRTANAIKNMPWWKRLFNKF